MADPLRLRILKALSAQLKTISPDDGYAFDLRDYEDDHGRPAERVFRGRALFGDNDPDTMLSILEHPANQDQVIEAPDAGTSVKRWPLIIQGFTPDDPVHPTDPAHALVANVIVALVKAKKKDAFKFLGFSQVTKLEIGHPVVRPPDNEISSSAYFFLTVILTLHEDLENPFS